jgi:hypothetical protein
MSEARFPKSAESIEGAIFTMFHPRAPKGDECILNFLLKIQCFEPFEKTKTLTT